MTTTEELTCPRCQGQRTTVITGKRPRRRELVCLPEVRFPRRPDGVGGRPGLGSRQRLEAAYVIGNSGGSLRVSGGDEKLTLPAVPLSATGFFVKAAAY